MTARRIAIVAWIAVVAASTLIVARLHINTDMSAFLPRSASPAQKILVDQFRDGVVSRLVLVAIEGVPADRSAAISKQLAGRLRGNAEFVAVENGEASGFERDRDFLWSHRYLLSDQVQSDRFTGAALHTQLEHDLSDLGSAAGFLLERTLAADPTGEMLYLLQQQQGGGGGGPQHHDGVWISPDGNRALMLVRLRAAGSDIDSAQRALQTIRSAFAQVAQDQVAQDQVAQNQAARHQAVQNEAARHRAAQNEVAQNQAARLVMTGPPVFAVEARDRIKSDATRLSVLASLFVATFLLVVYRSPRVLLLAVIPVVSGAVVGVAAVGLAFRTIHGITLGFGATLIGEAVDYAVYLFTQTAPDSPVEVTIRRIWPTLRLGVLTSICGFSAMLLSRFEGFAQLGLFTITGLAVAVCVTRWVLPVLIPAGFAGVRQSHTMLRIAIGVTGLHRLRFIVAAVVVVAAASLVFGKGAFWAGDLASLSPVPPAEQRLDQSLRHDMQARDASFLVVVRRPDQESALEAAERLTGLLAPVIRQGGLAGLDTPTRYLPSLAAQRARQAALPDPATLQGELDTALRDLPFQPGLFAPFIDAVGKARSSPLIDRSALDGTSLSLRLDSLLSRQRDGWIAMLSLRGVTAPASIDRAIAGEPDAVLVDLKAESNRLLGVYLREGASLSGLGAAAITVLLAISLRSLPRLLTVIAPLVAAVVTTLAVLRLGGHALSIFNLFGMLLVVAIGSNYCLFFDRQRGDPAGLPRVMASLLLANVCTVAGFGVLALSRTPVLHDLGAPVAIGTLLSLLFAAIIMSPANRSSAPDAVAR
ncbi:MAG TPA: MMPL family transporter [Rhodopila sp.]|nr:MMPL family transporter [Rhodopila sp.]